MWNAEDSVQDYHLLDPSSLRSGYLLRRQSYLYTTHRPLSKVQNFLQKSQTFLYFPYADDNDMLCISKRRRFLRDSAERPSPQSYGAVLNLFPVLNQR